MALGFLPPLIAVTLTGVIFAAAAFSRRKVLAVGSQSDVTVQETEAAVPVRAAPGGSLTDTEIETALTELKRSAAGIRSFIDEFPEDARFTGLIIDDILGTHKAPRFRHYSVPERFGRLHTLDDDAWKHRVDEVERIKAQIELLSREIAQRSRRDAEKGTADS